MSSGFVVVYSAYEPTGPNWLLPNTASPTAKPVAPEPNEATVPEKSVPGTKGMGNGTNALK